MNFELQNIILITCYDCPSIEVDCDSCVSEFAANGGCDKLGSDVSNLIPEGCFTCGDKAVEYCESISGKLL